MIFTGTEHQWTATRRRMQTPNGTYGKGEWMDSGQDPHLSPTVFLVEMDPNTEVETHFHRNNQFQVFLQGSGSIGPHALAPCMVHYAGAYTGYGPLKAGPQGLWYFTMRPVYEFGAQYLPERRDQLLRGPKRHFSSNALEPMTTDALAALSAVQSEDLTAPSGDKLAVQVLRLPPGASHRAISPHGSAGQFFVLLSGSICHDGQWLRRWEHLFVSEQEDRYTVQAGPQGAQVLLLQYPVKAAEYLAQEQALQTA